MWCVCLSQLGFVGVCVCVVDVRYKAAVQGWSTHRAAPAPSPARTRRWCGTSAIQWTHVASLPWWVSLAVYEAVEGPHKHSKINVRVCVCVCVRTLLALLILLFMHASLRSVWSRCQWATQETDRDQPEDLPGSHTMSVCTRPHTPDRLTRSLSVFSATCAFSPVFRHNEATEDVRGTRARVSLH